jgi:hypothetical protein
VDGRSKTEDCVRQATNPDPRDGLSTESGRRSIDRSTRRRVDTSGTPAEVRGGSWARCLERPLRLCDQITRCGLCGSPSCDHVLFGVHIINLCHLDHIYGDAPINTRQVKPKR